MRRLRPPAAVSIPLAIIAVAGLWALRGDSAAPEPAEPGVVDAGDHKSLQAAIDALPAGGGVVRIPPGNYELTEPLRLTTGEVLLEGAGPATHLINRNADGKPALSIGPADIEEKGNSRIWRVQVADLRISGSEKSGDGILARGVNEIYLTGVGVDHNGGHGVNLIDCYEDPRICDCLMTYNGGAGLNILRGHDIVVNANQFEENVDAVRCIDSFNLCMNGNNLDDHLGNGVVIENTYGSVLSGNMIEECKGIAVIMDRDCYGNTVSANVIAHNEGGGVELRDAWGCAISANTFTINGGHGVSVGPESGRIAITGNNFSDAHIGGKRKRDDRAGGVHLKDTESITVTGNLFSGTAEACVKTEGKCELILLVGNVGTEPGRFAEGETQPFEVTGSRVTNQSNIPQGE